MKNILMTLTTAALMTASFAQASEVHNRQVDQQQRIAQGVKSGSLTPRETARLENKEARVNRQIRADRFANGGNLTNKEKAQINREQNRLSGKIYNAKHDGPGR